MSDIWVWESSESELLSVSVVDSEGTKTDEKYELKSSAFSAGVLAVTSLQKTTALCCSFWCRIALW